MLRNAVKLLKEQLKKGYTSYMIRTGKAAAAASRVPLLRERNRRLNDRLHIGSSGYLTDQAAGTEGRYRYGVTKMADTGCEIIAVYNLLVRAGREKEFGKLVGEFESMRGSKVLLGLFGTSIRGMRAVLEREGVPVRILRGSDLKQMDQARAGILTFWWSETSMRIHTVMIEQDARTHRITAYNYDPWHGIYRLKAASVSELVRHRGIRPIAFLEAKEI